MEIAAGKIAEIVVAAVQAYTGNIPGLTSVASNFVSNISTMTASFGYSAVDEESHKSHVIFDHETDYFLMCKLDKVSKKRKGHIPLARFNKTELTVSMYFVKNTIECSRLDSVVFPGRFPNPSRCRRALLDPGAVHMRSQLMRIPPKLCAPPPTTSDSGDPVQLPRAPRAGGGPPPPPAGAGPPLGRGPLSSGAGSR